LKNWNLYNHLKEGCKPTSIPMCGRYMNETWDSEDAASLRQTVHPQLVNPNWYFLQSHVEEGLVFDSPTLRSHCFLWIHDSSWLAKPRKVIASFDATAHLSLANPKSRCLIWIHGSSSTRQT
jgi:hypothetical protein